MLKETVRRFKVNQPKARRFSNPSPLPRARELGGPHASLPRYRTCSGAESTLLQPEYPTQFERQSVDALACRPAKKSDSSVRAAEDYMRLPTRRGHPSSGITRRRTQKSGRATQSTFTTTSEQIAGLCGTRKGVPGTPNKWSWQTSATSSVRG